MLNQLDVGGAPGSHGTALISLLGLVGGTMAAALLLPLLLRRGEQATSNGNSATIRKERKFHWSIQPALAYEGRVLVGVTSQVEDGCKTMAPKALVFVPHKTLHGTIGMLIQ